MKLRFVETTWFTQRLKLRVDDAPYCRFQEELLRNPQKGDVMPGCAGLRKARMPDPARGKGRRGGLRVVYLYIPEACRIDLFDVYGKDEKDDLAPDEKKALAAMVKRVRQEAISAFARERGVK